MSRKKPKKPFTFRRSKRPDGTKASWPEYFRQLSKKAWESIFVRVMTIALLALSGYLYYNYFQNPKVNFDIRVEVIDYTTKQGIERAEIFIQDGADTLLTNQEGIARKTIRVRLKEREIAVTGSAPGYRPREKVIHVPLEKNRKFDTKFVLHPKNAVGE